MIEYTLVKVTFVVSNSRCEPVSTNIMVWERVASVSIVAVHA
jgi:hypothetical protein